MTAAAKRRNVVAFAEGPTCSVVVVTPEMAEQWLEANTVNRNLRPDRVAQYARDIEAGRWRLTGEPIKFSVTGRLLDGQHRLWAVIESARPAAMFVAQGLPDDAQPFMDSGAARTVADNLGMSGERNAPALASAARIGWIVDSGLINRDKREWNPSHSDLYEWIERNPTIRDSVVFATVGDAARGPISPSIRSYSHFRFRKVDESAADQFFVSLGTLANLPSGSPILALAARMRRARELRTRVSTTESLSITFRAWNLWRHGSSVRTLQITPANGSVRLATPI